MIVLDSDHLSVLQRPESRHYEKLVAAMAKSGDSLFVTTVISLENEMRGWLSAINRKQRVKEQLRYYRGLVELVDFYSKWRVVAFDQPASDQFTELRAEGIRVGTMDLKIASIAIANDALLLSANLSDFEKVSRLRVENWLR